MNYIIKRSLFSLCALARSSMLGATLVTTCLLSHTAFAQSGVQVYDNCNFDGDSAYVSEGEYASMKDIDFRNDRISSIRVPDGFEVRIYEDRKFRGDFATITSDIRCFDSFWDDRVSSLKVVVTRPVQERQFERQKRPSIKQPGLKKATASNVGSVFFEGSALRQTSENTWRLVRPNKSRSELSEVRRSDDSVFLRDQYTGERIRIDLFANEITMVQSNGQVERFEITSARAASSAGPRNNAAAAVNNSTPKVLRLNQRCVDYRAYTAGGIGGLRVYGSVEFRQFGKKPISGKFCIDDATTLELQKNNKNTDVYLEIAGQSYRFAPGEAHDVFKNTWYRRKTQLLYRAR